MAIELASQAAANAHARGNANLNNSTAAPREASFDWANIGYDSVDPITGVTTFISLPMGCPIDTMKPSKFGSSPEYNAMIQAKNEFLVLMQSLFDKLEPGQEDFVLGLKVQIRRRKEAEVPAAGTNSLTKGAEGIRLASAA